MEKKILIADDHPIYLMGLRALLSPLAGQYHIVDEALTTDDVISKLERDDIDILITDFSMPGDKYNDGLALIQLIKRRWPALVIIVVTMINNPGIERALRQLGVHGVLSKAGLSTELVHFIKGLTGAFASSKPSADAPALSGISLTPKESEVLRLLLRGLTVSDISTRLNRTKQTVSAQKKSAMRKLGVTSEYELYQQLQQLGLVS
ncbi:response regulator [Kosakonia cowanii]|jgi:two-component system capsular synthesis response regulator RcsB|uniref:response regulator n=1 Tax=Kosakonia cowanii TaxID=208223 RepID=UPI002158CE8F|nr:response regulator [Kosakonia cowanii]MDP9770987.1 two-component system capsular synthesis response regulator RcsB [Atlantibacter hermannii]MDF2623803.1 DNA-binding response regulator [Kosakonia cowanii]MDM9618488.1 response regulator [Kosakonia cowanii]MDP4561912.1 response regulator [Kosakonia cowanii]WPG21850.1 response regulator [Kosakonia cowanii]